MSLLDLPDELFTDIIFNHLTIIELLDLANTHKRLKKLVFNYKMMKYIEKKYYRTYNISNYLWTYIIYHTKEEIKQLCNLLKRDRYNFFIIDISRFGCSKLELINLFYNDKNDFMEISSHIKFIDTYRDF